jgi:hypothetical protein
MPQRSPAAGGTQRFESLAAQARRASEGDREGLLVRCAWCDRYSLGDEWMPADELPKGRGVERKLHDERITDSICPDCTKHPS